MGQANPDDERIEATVKRWWEIAAGLRHFVGPVWDQIEADIVTRLRYSAREDGAYTDDDVKAACRTLVNPQLHDICKYPGNWIGAFAKALDAAMGKRVILERQARLVGMADAVTDDERTVTRTALAEYRLKNWGDKMKAEERETLMKRIAESKSKNKKGNR